MNDNKFDFQEALSYIKAGETVQLTLNGTIRRYYLKDGVIMCTPNLKPHLEYEVNTFHIDAIMSDNWELVL